MFEACHFTCIYIFGHIKLFWAAKLQPPQFKVLCYAYGWYTYNFYLTVMQIDNNNHQLLSHS